MPHTPLSLRGAAKTKEEPYLYDATLQVKKTHEKSKPTPHQGHTFTLNPFRDCIPLVGLGGGWAESLGFTLMRVQIKDMPHHDEQQVVFVLDDPSGFPPGFQSSWVPLLSTGSCKL